MRKPRPRWFIKSRRRWAVLISGRGSNLAALLDARASELPEIEVALVVSSSVNAPGLLRARRAGVRTALLPRVGETKKIDWTALDRELRRAGVTHLFLAGFMRVVPESFVTAWENRILNLHPSLLPAYPGLESISRAHAEGAALGCTVHVVTKEVDAGAVIRQRRSLQLAESRGYSLATSEFLVHVDEQRLVREAIRRCSL